MLTNAYQIYLELRDNLNEASAGHWENPEILKKMNGAGRKIWMQLSMSPGDWFLNSVTLTPSNSLLTIPSDCAKPVYLEDATTGAPIPFSGTIRNRRLTRIPGATLETGPDDAYMLEKYIEINQDSYSGNVKLWYQKRFTEMHFGTGGSGSGATLIELQSSNYPNRANDYYNNQAIEIISGTEAGAQDTITDYVGSSLLATVTGTYDSTSVYGTICDLPEECLNYLIMDATMKLIMKPSSTLSEVVYQYMKTEWKDAKADFDDWSSTRINTSMNAQSMEI